jgi:ABC-type phosphate transport system substrate-binding protein
LVVVCGPAAARAEDVRLVVVVNRQNPTASLTLDQVRRIFMKQQRLWPTGETIVPVDWDARTDMRRLFSMRVLGRTVREMAEFWVQQSVTRGVTPPSTLASGAAVVRFVATVPGAISYVPLGVPDDEVKPIRVQGLP